jgi:hypothetical protein
VSNLRVVARVDGFVESCERFRGIVLEFEDVLPTMLPGIEVFDKLDQRSGTHRVTGTLLHTRSSISSAALNSASTAPISATSSDLLLSLPNCRCMDFMLAVLGLGMQMRS